MKFLTVLISGFVRVAKFFKLPQNNKASIAELNKTQAVIQAAIQDGIDLKNKYWLRADPVELRADLAAVYMFGNQHIKLSAEQINIIKNTIQPLLNDFQIQLHTTLENRWYVELADPPAMKSINPEEIIGKDILPFLPKSYGKINWVKLQTEIQMALFQLPNNFGVNSLWFWGEESLQRQNNRQNNEKNNHPQNQTNEHRN